TRKVRQQLLSRTEAARAGERRRLCNALGPLRLLMLAQPRLDNNSNGTGTTGLLVSSLLVGQTPNESLTLSRPIESLTDHIQTSCNIFFPSPKGLRSVRRYIRSVGRLPAWQRLEF